MNFIAIPHTRNAILPTRYTEYNDFSYYVFESFYWGMNSLESAGLHILTYSVNNLTLAVI